MNMLLIFFAIPLAIVILSAILETYMRCPIKVAGVFFSILIVVAFAFFGTVEAIVAALAYTILSFIAAYIVRLVINRNCRRTQDVCECYDYRTPNYNLLNANVQDFNTTPIDSREDINNLENNTLLSNNMCRRCR